jgi:hypothetical protein
MSSSSWISSYWDFGAGDFGTVSFDLLGFKPGNPEEAVLRCGGFFPHGLVGGMMISLRLNGMATQKMSRRTRSRSYESFTRWGCTFPVELWTVLCVVSSDVGKPQPFDVGSFPREATLNRFQKDN